MPIIIGGILLIGVAYFLFKGSGNNPSAISGSGNKKCRNCEYGYKLLAEGVMCGTEESKVFKNNSHISGCLSFISKSK